MSPSKYMVSFAVIGGMAVAVAGCGGGSSNSNNSKAASASSSSGGTSVSNSQPAAPKSQNVTMLIKTDAEHGKLGPGHVWHDAYLPANLSVKAGETVSVTVWNYDNGAHSFDAPSLGLNQVIAPGSAKSPHKTTFTFTAPSKAGSYQWFCALPCDPWAMAHNGYMRGFVTVTA